MKNSVVTDILICNDAVLLWQFLVPGSWFIPRQRRIGRHDSSSSSCLPQPLQPRSSWCPFSWYPSWRHLSSSVAVDLASSWNPRPKYPTVSRAGLLSVPYWHWQYYTIIVLSLLISVFVPLRCCVLDVIGVRATWPGHWVTSVTSRPVGVRAKIWPRRETVVSVFPAAATSTSPTRSAAVEVFRRLST